MKGQTMYLSVYDENLLSREQIRLVAEFVAVMVTTNHLALASQVDEPGEVAFSWFEVTMARSRLKDKAIPNTVVDTTATWAPNKKFESMPTARLAYHQLHTHTQAFIDRLVIELDRYFPAPDSDQLIAMKLHPLIEGGVAM